MNILLNFYYYFFLIFAFRPYLVHLYKSTGSYYCHLDIGIGVGDILKFHVKVFFV